MHYLDVDQFYNYHGFTVELLNKYDERSPDFVRNIVMGYDILREELGLTPIFSFENIMKPSYRKLFKKDNKDLKDLPLIKQSRLSVMSIDTKSWKIILKMGKIK